MAHLEKYKERLKPTTPPPMQWRGLEELGDDKAIFVSLEGRAKRKSSRGHLSQEQMFVEFDRHFTMCPKTSVAVIICDTWYAPTYDHWRPIIKTIAERGVYVEFYLIGPGWKVALPSLP